jgi:hypothetical protein
VSYDLLFPPPDNPYEDGKVRELEVIGAAVLKVVTSDTSRDVLFITVVQNDDGIYGFRFLLPNHSKTVRTFFHGGKIKRVPTKNGVYTVDKGAFLLRFEGRVVGEDNLETIKDPPKAIFVMHNVKAQHLPIPIQPVTQEAPTSEVSPPEVAPVKTEA